MFFGNSKTVIFEIHLVIAPFFSIYSIDSNEDFARSACILDGLNSILKNVDKNTGELLSPCGNHRIWNIVPDFDCDIVICIKEKYLL